MPLITLILTLIVIGVSLWAINSFIPMDGKIKTILNVAVVLVVVLWLLTATGILGSISSVRVPTVR